MKTIKTYSAFNQRRYSDPWVAIVDMTTGKPDFAKKVGGYTGEYKTGEAGDLFVADPQENAVYMYGQKDYRGGHTEKNYAIYKNGEFEEIDKKALLEMVFGE